MLLWSKEPMRKPKNLLLTKLHLVNFSDCNPGIICSPLTSSLWHMVSETAWKLHSRNARRYSSRAINPIETQMMHRSNSTAFTWGALNIVKTSSARDKSISIQTSVNWRDVLPAYSAQKCSRHMFCRDPTIRKQWFSNVVARLTSLRGHNTNPCSRKRYWQGCHYSDGKYGRVRCGFLLRQSPR